MLVFYILGLSPFAGNA